MGLYPSRRAAYNAHILKVFLAYTALANLKKFVQHNAHENPDAHETK
jgi:hypothetical protein